MSLQSRTKDFLTKSYSQTYSYTVQLRPHVLRRQLIDLGINMFYICPVRASLFTAKNFSCAFKTYKENTKCREDKNRKSERFLSFR